MRIDCRHFSGSAPCGFHKRDGRACDRCGDYERAAFRILIVKLAAAGDVLRTTCILPALHRAHSGAQITWVTERPAMPLLEGNPLIDRIVPRDTAVERLMVEEFDLGLGLDVDAEGGALFALARCRTRAGYLLDGAGRVMPADARAEHWWRMGLDDTEKRANRRSYPDLLYELCGLPGPPARPSFFIPHAARVAVRARLAGALDGFDRVLVLNTGGGRRWAQKKWTPSHSLAFVSLIRRLHPATAVVLAGGPEERQLNAALLAASRDPGIVDAGCDNSVHEFGAILELADLVVTSDSLALHVAIALARPVIALVGPTSPWELEMYGTGSVVTAEVPCLACYRAECDKPVTCMELLTPERVYAACAGVLGSGAPLLPGHARPVPVLPVHP